MGAKRVLFLDDRSNRIESARRRFPPPKFDLTCVFTAKECLDKLSRYEFDQVYLDYDLEYSHYDLNKSSGMEVVEYLCAHTWPIGINKPEFMIHSINKFGAETMGQKLVRHNFKYSICPWQYTKYIMGIIAGAFDIIHPGYIKMFKDAKTICQHLTIAVNLNGKRRSILSYEEKQEILYAIRYVDKVISYTSEKELDKIISKFDIKINGSDREGKTSRPDVKQYYHDRNHNWSTTNFIERIKEIW